MKNGPIFKYESQNLEEALDGIFPLGVGGYLLPPLANPTMYDHHFDCISKFDRAELSLMKLPSLPLGRWFIQDDVEMGHCLAMNRVGLKILPGFQWLGGLLESASSFSDHESGNISSGKQSMYTITYNKLFSYSSTRKESPSTPHKMLNPEEQAGKPSV